VEEREGGKEGERVWEGARLREERERFVGFVEGNRICNEILIPSKAVVAWVIHL
jgi:hypothetical protein